MFITVATVSPISGSHRLYDERQKTKNISKDIKGVIISRKLVRVRTSNDPQIIPQKETIAY